MGAEKRITGDALDNYGAHFRIGDSVFSQAYGM